jgi:hypothetical protein
MCNEADLDIVSNYSLPSLPPGYAFITHIISVTVDSFKMIVFTFQLQLTNNDDWIENHVLITFLLKHVAYR